VFRKTGIGSMEAVFGGRPAIELFLHVVAKKEKDKDW
jgi:hypothetical protein